VTPSPCSCARDIIQSSLFFLSYRGYKIYRGQRLPLLYATRRVRILLQTPPHLFKSYTRHRNRNRNRNRLLCVYNKLFRQIKDRRLVQDLHRLGNRNPPDFDKYDYLLPYSRRQKAKLIKALGKQAADRPATSLLLDIRQQRYYS
jgi:hypothetical protein